MAFSEDKIKLFLMSQPLTNVSFRVNGVLKVTNKEGKYQLEVSIEDQKLIPEIQQNLQAGIYNEGPLSSKYETGVAFFHDLYLNKLNLEKAK